jgi:hypothetical protein
MLASTCSIRFCSLARVKFLSRAFTALNLLPSIAATTAIADRGCFKREEILACEAAGVTPLGSEAANLRRQGRRRFGEPEFIYDPGEDAFRCPGGEKLTRRYASVEEGLTLHCYGSAPLWISQKR